MPSAELIVTVEQQLEHHRRAAEAFVATLRRLTAEVPDVQFDGTRWLTSAAERLTDAELETVRGGCEHRHDDPVAVYARPRCKALGETVEFSREYHVATIAPGAKHVEPGWAEAMRADGLPEAVVRACSRRIAELSVRP